MYRFDGQRILVIGGSSGIGLATAQLAAAAGAAVTIASRSQARLDAAASRIGGNAAVQALDVTDEAQVAAFLQDGPEWDHVVVTGSQVRISPVRDLPLETAVAAFDSKFWGFYRVARLARIRSGGSLSVVAGYLATRPVAGRALMGAINAALESLVRGLALELRPVRVNAVSPGVVDTSMWAAMDPLARDEMFRKLTEVYPAGVVGRPEDIAAQLLLLAATPYATGTVVTLDGGASIA